MHSETRFNLDQKTQRSVCRPTSKCTGPLHSSRLLLPQTPRRVCAAGDMRRSATMRLYCLWHGLTIENTKGVYHITARQTEHSPMSNAPC